MAKLLEKNGAELMASLVNIARPVGNLAEDEELFEKLDLKKIPAHAKKNKLAFVMFLYSDVVPILLGSKHLKDIMQILAEIEGKSIKDMAGMGGAELIEDAINAWREQIGPFFKLSGLTALIKSLEP